MWVDNETEMDFLNFSGVADSWPVLALSKAFGDGLP
jgi:hypothetical protein